MLCFYWVEDSHWLKGRQCVFLYRMVWRLTHFFCTYAQICLVNLEGYFWVLCRFTPPKKYFLKIIFAKVWSWLTFFVETLFQRVSFPLHVFLNKNHKLLWKMAWSKRFIPKLFVWYSSRDIVRMEWRYKFGCASTPFWRCPLKSVRRKALGWISYFTPSSSSVPPDAYSSVLEKWNTDFIPQKTSQ